MWPKRKPQRRIIERGILHYNESIRYRYIIEIDKTGQKRKYAFRPGECVELDVVTNNPIDIIDFVSPSMIKDVPAAFKEPWPEYEVIEQDSIFQRIIKWIKKGVKTR